MMLCVCCLYCVCVCARSYACVLSVYGVVRACVVSVRVRLCMLVCVFASCARCVYARCVSVLYEMYTCVEFVCVLYVLRMWCGCRVKVVCMKCCMIVCMLLDACPRSFVGVVVWLRTSVFVFRVVHTCVRVFGGCVYVFLFVRAMVACVCMLCMFVFL